MLKFYGVKYKTFDGRIVSIFVSNEQKQNKEYNIAKSLGFYPTRFERVI